MPQNARQVKIELKYNSHDVSKDFSKYLQSITYDDYEEEQSDELVVRLRDNEKLFQNDWYPQKGAKLSCKVFFKGTKEVLNCGTFTIDEISSDFSNSGDVLEIKALAATINSPVRTTNTRFFEKITLNKIAQYFGNIYGFKVAGEQGNVYINRVNQTQESDLAFLKRISKLYGYIFKITDGLLTFTSTGSLTDTDVLFTVGKEDFSSVSLSDSGAKIYKACSVKYFNAKTKKLCTYTAKRDKGTDTLKLNLKCASKEEAKLKAEANLKAGSKAVKGSITLEKTNTKFFAGVNFQLKDIGILSGKYHIKHSTHDISSDAWTITGDIEKC